MVIAGLTGGIATGKSTVAAILEEAGAIIIDADKIAHEVVRRELPAWRKIVEKFGQDILQENRDIDREKLGRIIFNDSRRKEELNRIVHPFVFKELEDQMDEIQRLDPGAVVIQDIPLLFESGMNHPLPRIIVVYVPEPLQYLRLIERNHLSRAEAMARIRSQIPIEEKKKLADILIDNSGTFDQTRKRSLEVYEMLKLSTPAA